jgi:hypothetical protein
MVPLVNLYGRRRVGEAPLGEVESQVVDAASEFALSYRPEGWGLRMVDVGL